MMTEHTHTHTRTYSSYTYSRLCFPNNINNLFKNLQMTHIFTFDTKADVSWREAKMVS